MCGAQASQYSQGAGADQDHTPLDTAGHHRCDWSGHSFGVSICGFLFTIRSSYACMCRLCWVRLWLAHRPDTSSCLIMHRWVCNIVCLFISPLQSCEAQEMFSHEHEGPNLLWLVDVRPFVAVIVDTQCWSCVQVWRRNVFGHKSWLITSSERIREGTGLNAGIQSKIFVALFNLLFDLFAFVLPLG